VDSDDYFAAAATDPDYHRDTGTCTRATDAGLSLHVFAECCCICFGGLDWLCKNQKGCLVESWDQDSPTSQPTYWALVAHTLGGQKGGILPQHWPGASGWSQQVVFTALTNWMLRHWGFKNLNTTKSQAKAKQKPSKSQAKQEKIIPAMFIPRPGQQLTGCQGSQGGTQDAKRTCFRRHTDWPVQWF